MRPVQIARPRRAELERADHAILVEERRHDDVAEPPLDDLVVRRRAPGHLGEVLDDEGTALDDGALVDGPAELLDRVMPGVGEDTGVLALGAIVEDEHLVAVERRQPEAQLGPPEEGPQLVLQRLEARVRDDRLLVDQVALERGQHFLVRDLDGPEDRESPEHEAVGRQHLAEQLGVEELAVQPPPHLVGQHRDGADGLHLDEPPVEVHLEVAIEAGVGVGGGEDQRIVDVELDAVDPFEHERVGEEEPHRADHRRVEVDPAAQRAVLGAQQPLERRRGVEALEEERDQDGRELLLEEGRRKDARHEHVDQGAVALDHAQVRDRAQELRHLPDLLAHRPDERPLGRGVVTELLGPEREQRRQAQLALERKAVRVGLQRCLKVGRALQKPAGRSKHGDIVASGASRPRGPVV